MHPAVYWAGFLIVGRDNRMSNISAFPFRPDAMRVMVTGGAGFLGSHLCARLVEQGHEVLCVDNFYSGTKFNIIELMDWPNFELMRHDVTLPLYVEVDRIYNLACPASPVHYQSDPVQTVKTSVHGAINVLGLARRTGARILQASTSEVYGDPVSSPQHEAYWGNVNPIGPRACYDEGKRCAETLFFDYHRQHSVDIRVARIFNTYGPKMHPDDGRVVSNFVVQALRNQPITVYGDGSQTRSLCYVDDLLDGLMDYMNLEQKDPGPVNLGTSFEITIAELARRIIELTGSRSQIVYKALPQDDPVQRKPDTTKAQSLLNWDPQVSIKQGLSNTIDYFDQLLNENQIVASRAHPIVQQTETVEGMTPRAGRDGWPFRRVQSSKRKLSELNG